MADVFFAILLSILAIFLILLVLVQRGRGGGLAGALGGMGGSSAFGAKAGDVFTRITIITAAIWIGICLVAVFWAQHGGDALSTASPTAPAESSRPLDMPAGTLPGQGPASGQRPGGAATEGEVPAATNGTPRDAAGSTPARPAASGSSETPASPSPPAENP
jgi:preprotein translocase subunit SecG